MLSNKITTLAESARYDVCLSSCSTGASGKQGRSRNPRNPLHDWIYPAAVPGQGIVHILKILQSNSCKNSCSYCQFSSKNSNLRRTTLSPEELAVSFMEMFRKRLVSGIFISSGVCRSPSHSMEEMVKTAELLRKRYRFKGYIHLKIIPGCNEELILAAAELADRLSINMEAPTRNHLHNIAPDKDLISQIIPAVSVTANILKKKKDSDSFSRIKAKSQTTQFVVGASNEKDIEIIKSVDTLYRNYYMFRSYFSAYQEKWAVETQSQSKNKEQDPFKGYPLLREHRLYQCDFLMRAYGFRFPELIFDSKGNIPLETDPKTAWAMMNQDIFPIEINKADFASLIKVPGIGPQSAEKIIKERKNNHLKNSDDLKRTGAWSNRACGWITLDGKKTEDSNASSQKWLFEELAPSNWKKPEDFGIKTSAEKDFPAQKGKWVNYTFNKNKKKIWCR
ncbi:MAG: helix-hairpin-helix domain-containing protein [Spirochaetales bacterium]|nr:helix-hairpin-helix domain-containing protein [Spirochaetales bacterium]